MMTRLALVILVTAACGGKQQPASSSSPAPDCKAAARRLADDSSLRDKDGLANGLLARCQADRWSDEARSCLVERGEAGPCTLTEAQRSGIEQERARQLELETTRQDG